MKVNKYIYFLKSWIFISMLYFPVFYVSYTYSWWYLFLIILSFGIHLILSIDDHLPLFSIPKKIISDEGIFYVFFTDTENEKNISLKISKYNGLVFYKISSVMLNREDLNKTIEDGDFHKLNQVINDQIKKYYSEKEINDRNLTSSIKGKIDKKWDGYITSTVQRDKRIDSILDDNNN